MFLPLLLYAPPVKGRRRDRGGEMNVEKEEMGGGEFLVKDLWLWFGAIFETTSRLFLLVFLWCMF